MRALARIQENEREVLGGGKRGLRVVASIGFCNAGSTVLAGSSIRSMPCTFRTTAKQAEQDIGCTIFG
ncbi:hypothetical protein ASC96_05785 [Rhizobium sp. Root1204]|nr:hypothetical protein ASC96_05785 [Rhizobium sp. Root1204]